jgi:hypothetical protein
MWKMRRGLLIIAALVATASWCHSFGPSEAIIVAEPAASPILASGARLTVLELAVPYHPERSARPRRPQPVDLDKHDPWTGEDLAPQLEVIAAARPRMEIDRRDPWDPSMLYPPVPGLFDGAVLDPDPWASRASAAHDGIATRSPLPVPLDRDVY